MVGINSVKGYMPNCHRDLVWTEDLIGGKKKKKRKESFKMSPILTNMLVFH